MYYSLAERREDNRRKDTKILVAGLSFTPAIKIADTPDDLNYNFQW